MRIEAQTAQSQTVVCYRCNTPIMPGEGRYNVLPGESYCSWACLHQTLPHVAEAIRLFVRAPRHLHESAAAAPASGGGAPLAPSAHPAWGRGFAEAVAPGGPALIFSPPGPP